MRIMNRDELASMPAGTVFTSYTPHTLGDSMYIKLESKKNDKGQEFWYGELPLTPTIEEYSEGEFVTQWCTVDTTYYDYTSSELFAVFSKTEVQQLINCLQWALSGCESYFDQDIWFRGDDKPFSDDEWDEIKDY